MSGEKNGQRQTVGKILRYIRRYRFLVAGSLLLALAQVALTLYVPILTGNGVDLIVGRGLVDLPGLVRILWKIGAPTP